MRQAQNLNTIAHRSQVWYDPIGEPDDDGGVEFGLYRYPAGEPGKREPMKGMVQWLPYFDPDTLDSSDRKEKKEIQKQLLYDTWVLLGAASREELEETERGLLALYPGDRKRALYTEAKKVVLERLGRRGQRQRRRQAKLGAAASKDEGQGEAGESGYGGSDSEMSESDEDECNELQQMRQKAFEKRVMPPPKRPAKGKAPATRQNPRGTSSTASSRSPSINFQMSGANGVRSSVESEHDFEREPIGGSSAPRRSPSRVRSEPGASAGNAKRSGEESETTPPRKKAASLGHSILGKSAAGYLSTPASLQGQGRKQDAEGNDDDLADDLDEDGWSRNDMNEATRRSLPPG